MVIWPSYVQVTKNMLLMKNLEASVERIAGTLGFAPNFIC